MSSSRREHGASLQEGKDKGFAEAPPLHSRMRLSVQQGARDPHDVGTSEGRLASTARDLDYIAASAPCHQSPCSTSKSYVKAPQLQMTHLREHEHCCTTKFSFLEVNWMGSTSFSPSPSLPLFLFLSLFISHLVCNSPIAFLCKVFMYIL